MNMITNYRRYIRAVSVENEKVHSFHNLRKRCKQCHHVTFTYSSTGSKDLKALPGKITSLLSIRILYEINEKELLIKFGTKTILYILLPG